MPNSSKSKSKGNKKKDQKRKPEKANNKGDNNEQAKQKGNTHRIVDREELNRMSLGELVSVSLTNQHKDEIGQICAQYTQLALYGSPTNVAYNDTQRNKSAVESGSKGGEQHNMSETDPTKLENLVVNVADVSNEQKKVTYCEQVASLFPELRAVLIYYHPRLNDLLPLLFKNWNQKGAQITTIELYGGRTDDFITQFCEALGSLNSLIRLVWDMPPLKAPAITNLSLLLGQLRMFQIDHYEGNIVPLFRHFGDSLKDLRINNTSKQVKIKWVELAKVFEQVPQSCANLAIIELGYQIKFDNKEKVFELLCNQCKHLQCFEISALKGISPSFYLTQLSKLPNISQINFGPSLTDLTKEIAAKFKPFEDVGLIAVNVDSLLNYTVDQFRNTFGPLFPKLRSFKLQCSDPVLENALIAEAETLFPNLDPRADRFKTVKEKCMAGGIKYLVDDDGNVIERIEENYMRNASEEVANKETDEVMAQEVENAMKLNDVDK